MPKLKSILALATLVAVLAASAPFAAAATIPQPVLGGWKIGPGAGFTGPAIVEQYDTTTWVPRGWSAVADHTGNLMLERT